MLNTKLKLSKGASGDAVLLTFIKFVTMALGLVTTRLLSEYLSVHDYGTYSQILLIISTVSSFTILGMMDGVNFFYCDEQDEAKRESYTATIFSLQIVVGTISGLAIMLLSVPICLYFKNLDLKSMLIFAAVLPVMQNLLGMFQVLLVSVGKARMLAVRNFVVSVVRLIAVVIVLTALKNIAFILAVTLVLDTLQIAFFVLMLKKSGCKIRFSKADVRLLKKILKYCVPMAVFTAVNALNRDIDKYLISLMTDTETLAVYANASKPLPFDIIMASFCTVLIPHITRFVSKKKFNEASALYKLFLEIAYITTGILCCAAITVSPQLMNLLYSDKYVSGLSVFVVYILVDLVRFTNITLVLSAAGKTKWLMVMGVSALGLNGVLNFVFFKAFGIIGPAVATLITTIILGAFMLAMSAKVLETTLFRFFSKEYFLLFAAESVVLTVLLRMLSAFLSEKGVHYFLILAGVAGLFGVIMLVLNGKRLLSNMKEVNKVLKQKEE
ncbi:MAG: polysaccharide biosynthesis protein [Clostridia bacterium]|nr:polysaccharide biosynthesis protein [Clostridia bacterium]MBQ8574551.1 polysaccharide biosynthesis protein [Clostridia bacterium]